MEPATQVCVWAESNPLHCLLVYRIMLQSAEPTGQLHLCWYPLSPSMGPKLILLWSCLPSTQLSVVQKRKQAHLQEGQGLTQSPTSLFRVGLWHRKDLCVKGGCCACHNLYMVTLWQALMVLLLRHGTSQFVTAARVYLSSWLSSLIHCKLQRAPWVPGLFFPPRHPAFEAWQIIDTQ